MGHGYSRSDRCPANWSCPFYPKQQQMTLYRQLDHDLIYAYRLDQTASVTSRPPHNVHPASPSSARHTGDPIERWLQAIPFGPPDIDQRGDRDRKRKRAGPPTLPPMSTPPPSHPSSSRRRSGVSPSKKRKLPDRRSRDHDAGAGVDDPSVQATAAADPDQTPRRGFAPGGTPQLPPPS